MAGGGERYVVGVVVHGAECVNASRLYGTECSYGTECVNSAFQLV